MLRGEAHERGISFRRERNDDLLARFGEVAVAVAWALYALFAPAGQGRSLLVAFFRVAYAIFLGIGTVFMFPGLPIATGAADLGPDVALLMFAAFDFAWFVGLIAFGTHLVLLGAPIIRSHIAPRTSESSSRSRAQRT